jgi:hypothetical protein
MKRVVVAFLLAFNPLCFEEDWVASAQRDMGTPAGKQYEIAAAQFAASALGPMMGKCVTTMPQEFALYFEISVNGAISKSYASVSTPIATCFSKGLSQLVWPKPPSAPFIFKLGMFGNPKDFEH